MSTTRGAIIWSLAERYLGLVIALTASMIVARLLTPTEVGLFSLCAAILAVSSTIREFGVSEYIIQERALDDDKLRRAYAVAVLIAWPIGGVVFLARHAVAAHYGQPELARIIGVLALSYVLLPLATPAYALLSRDMQFKKLLFVHAASGLAGAITSVLMAYNGFGPISLAWGMVATIATQLIGVSMARPRSSFLLPSFRGLGPILKFGSTLVSARVVESTTNNAHEFFIAHYTGFAAVGLFSRAKGLVDIFQTSVTAAVARVATPDMAASLRKDQSLVSTFSRGTVLFTCLSWSFSGFVALAAPEIIGLMFGSQWVAAAGPASLLAIATLPHPFYALCGSVVAATGQVRRRVAIAMRWCPVHIAVLWVGSQWGLEWVATLWLITNIVIAWANAREVRSALKTSYRAMYTASLRSVPVALTCIAAQAAVLWTGRAWGLHPLLLLGATLSAATLAFLLAAAAVRHPAFVEFKHLMSLLRQRKLRSS
jgi:O-antigen/teichoic acid export membrane protein